MAISQQPSSNPAAAYPLRWTHLSSLGSPQATRISERGGRTELHTSNLIYVSHPSSSTSSGGVCPKASHTGPLPCEAACPEEVRGTARCAALTNVSKHMGAPSSSQDQKHSSVVALGLLSLLGKAEPVLGQRGSSSRSRHLAVGPVLPESYQRRSQKSDFANE